MKVACLIFASITPFLPATSVAWLSPARGGSRLGFRSGFKLRPAEGEKSHPKKKKYSFSRALYREFASFNEIEVADDVFADIKPNGEATPPLQLQPQPQPVKFPAVEDEPRGKAFPQQTPHSGRHFVPSHPFYKKGPWMRLKRWLARRRGRFMEGWYYRLTLPDNQGSFAVILLVEDAGNRDSELRMSSVQVVGPQDTYLVQADQDDTKFWAWKEQQGLGCTFSYLKGVDTEAFKYRTALTHEEWYDSVESGVQVLPTHMMGKVVGHDGTKGGVLEGQGVPGYCQFDFSVDPICGFGNVGERQKSCAGWLASFDVFEPHWQVTLADARATGSITWQNRTYHFQDAKFYAEKNWGAALPSKWYWTQCNSFRGYDQLAVTAGGGIRYLPLGKKESLGMVSVHYNGALYEAVPWVGSMEWKVATWGSWELRGRSTFGDRPFEVEVIYSVDPEQTPGLKFRAPTADHGLIYFCRDTFEANTTLSLWELEWDAAAKEFVRKSGPPLIDRATSMEGGAEVGGGPWWDEWNAESTLTKPVMTLLQLPIRANRLRKRMFRRRR